LIIINDTALEERMNALCDFYFKSRDELARMYVERCVDEALSAVPNIPLAVGRNEFDNRQYLD